MKTFYLPGTLAYSQAMQEIFITTGHSMFPRQVGAASSELQCAWAYDVSEKQDEEAVKLGKLRPIFKPCEMLALYKLCNSECYSPWLWHKITDLIQSFPNQERFSRATYLQAHIIAQAFYAFSIKQSCKN